MTEKKERNMEQFEVIPNEENLCLSGNHNHPNIKGKYKDALHGTQCKALGGKEGGKLTSSISED